MSLQLHGFLKGIGDRLAPKTSVYVSLDMLIFLGGKGGLVCL